MSAKISVEEMTLIMDALYEHRAAAAQLEWMAELFDRLMWLLDDNGAALHEVLERWLESEHKDRVVIALASKEWFPFQDPNRMRDVFAQIATRWPDLGGRCREIAEQRRLQSRDQ